MSKSEQTRGSIANGVPVSSNSINGDSPAGLPGETVNPIYNSSSRFTLRARKCQYHINGKCKRIARNAERINAGIYGNQYDACNGNARAEECRFFFRKDKTAKGPGGIYKQTRFE